ncbi:serine/arginine repetitive matrix protein 2 [Vigna radiata var. radiata]|uniref:Serine/arginine repetitive matrix protein 2 n=1 Tax=Vigna radiata var. radiata TaxID=3916 RepID=A0A1S3UE03_VIGRR|nr:serine/arginine repetitive matrix protein 2 [Vigna radiata var. radiata]
MSKLSNSTLQRPSNIVVQRPHRKEKDMVMFLEHDKLARDFSNLSNEAYHVESSSVPFVWESQPGTPKVRFKENSLPPLTPPPSYFQNATGKTTPKVIKNKNSPKSSFLQTLFPKRPTRKDGAPSQTGSQNIWSYSSSSPSSSSSSSSSLSFSSPRPTSYSVPSSPMIHPRKGVEDEDMYEVTSSSLCFGNARSRGCYSSIFKKVLLGDFL